MTHSSVSIFFEEDHIEHGIDLARNLLQAIKEHGKDFKDDLQKLDLFFLCSLEPYYSPMCEGGMSNDLGHLNYRLAQLVPIETRMKIKIYPSSFKQEHEQDFNDGSEFWDWTTLEEWCLEWYDRNDGIIPEMTNELQETKQLLLSA